MREHSVREFYDRISGVYDLIADRGERDARERGLECLEVREGERVLEVGFGTGHALVHLAQAVGDQGRVEGIDISEGMCAVASRLIRSEGLETRVTLQVGEVPPLPYPNGIFDAVFLSFTLELFAPEVIPVVLAEIGRVLAPDGRLGVVSMATVMDGERESVTERTYKWFHRHFPHVVDCRPIDLELIVREAGFTVSRDERLEIFTMPVAVVVARRDARQAGR